jgi:hypothetical protein
MEQGAAMDTARVSRLLVGLCACITSCVVPTLSAAEDEFPWELFMPIFTFNATGDCQPIRFEVDPRTVDLVVGVVEAESRMLTATVLDESGVSLDATGVTWSSGDESVVNLIALVGPHTVAEAVRPSGAPITITASYDDGCQTKEATALATVGCVDLDLLFIEKIVSVDGLLPIAVSAVDPNGMPVEIDETRLTWSSSNESVATVDPPAGSASVDVQGVAPGVTTITVFFDEGTCGTRTATVDVEVRGIAGVWHLTPITQLERCRYGGGDWWIEDPFFGFDISVSQPQGPNSDSIESTIPGTGSVLTGTWNAATGAFVLSIATSNMSECGYLWGGGVDLCGGAVDCQLESCRNVTDISGSTNRLVDQLDAESTWYYAVTFSYETGSGRAETTWECEGEATYDGIRWSK